MMNELISVKSENGKQLVSGRELYEVLEVKTQFTIWIKRMIDYGFQENVDYTAINQKRLTAQGNTTEFTDYILTIEMAKHLAMVQRTEIGMKVRNYFIECENQTLNQVPQLTAEQMSILKVVQSQTKEERMLAMIDYKEIVTQPLIEKIESDAPKVDYFDNVLDSSHLLTTTEVAKDLSMTATKLNKILNEKGIQYKNRKKAWILYSQYDYLIAEKYADYKITEYSQSLRWTEKGRKWIINLIQES